MSAWVIILSWHSYTPFVIFWNCGPQELAIGTEIYIVGLGFSTITLESSCLVFHRNYKSKVVWLEFCYLMIKACSSTNNKIPFFPFIIQKDFFGFILILCLYLLQTHFGISSFSHPDNALEVCGLLTPLHIVPEWYFLCQYAMLKAVPNKNAGFIILLTSIFTFFIFKSRKCCGRI